MISYGAAVMLRGSMSSGNIDDDDDALLAYGFSPTSQELYEKPQPDGEKNEGVEKQALIIEKWAMAARQHTMMFCLLRGQDHRKGRIDCIIELERVREARPGLFDVELVSNTSEVVGFIYCSQILESA